MKFFGKKEKFHDMWLTIVCAKFNNWKLTTSLFLFFNEDIVQFCVDDIFVQRTELLLILKTV